MRNADTNQPIGETFGPDHLLGHIEEPYYVPSLLARAIEVEPVAPVTKWAIASLWGNQERIVQFDGIAKHQLRLSLRRYMRHQLNVPGRLPKEM